MQYLLTPEEYEELKTANARLALDRKEIEQRMRRAAYEFCQDALERKEGCVEMFFMALSIALKNTPPVK